MSRILDAVRRLVTRTRPMRIHLVCYEPLDGWILGKIARRLHHELADMGLHVSLGNKADPTAEINHHICYYDYVDPVDTIETVMLTHIDDEREFGKVMRQLTTCGVAMGICMSLDTVHRLAHSGVPRDRLCFISPAHDGVMAPRRTLVGLTTRLYDDGRKREFLLEDLAGTIAPADFRFAIMGSGWDRIVERLRGRGFDVEYADHFDEAAYRELVSRLDYYLYLGEDEGSMGFLDALAAGVATIVTPQGFHLDVPGGITHEFRDIDDLRRVFAEIAAVKRRRADGVAALTWREYAHKHVLVWEYVRGQRHGEELSALAVAPRPADTTTHEYRRIDRWMRTPSNGWASPDVAARFEAGASGGYFLEVLEFGPGMAEAPAAKEVLALLRRTGVERGVLLDVGCGNGVYGAMLAAAESTRGWQYVGVDVNSLSVESCRRRLPGARFEVVADGAPLPFADASVDVILASGVFEYPENPFALLAEFRRVSRAWVLLGRISFRPDKPAAIYAQTVRHAWGVEHHCLHVFNEADLEGAIARTGFEIVRREHSEASGEWTLPDDPVPLQHFSYLLRKV